MGRKKYRNRARSLEGRAEPVGKPLSAGVPAAPALPTPNWVVALWYAAAATTSWAFGYAIIRSSDLWWHLAAGEFMARHGQFLYTDPWSYTFQGKPWLNDAWLSDLIYYWWVVAFGLQSLAWWKWSVIVATYVLLMRTLHRVTGDLLSAYAGAVLAVATAEAFLDIRPHLYSLLAFSVLLSLTLGRERQSWWLPLLFLIWVQLHAMFVFGLMALAVLLAPGLIFGQTEERKRSALIGVSCVRLCLINPNFVTVFTRPIRYALSGSLYLTLGEWLPPFAPGGIHSPLYPFAIGVFVAGCVILLMRRVPGRSQPVPLAGMALGALTLAMSLKSRRFVPLFAIAQSIVLASALAPWVRASFARLSASARRLCAQVIPALALGLGLWWLWPYPAASYAFLFLAAEDTLPRGHGELHRAEPSLRQRLRVLQLGRLSGPADAGGDEGIHRRPRGHGVRRRNVPPLLLVLGAQSGWLRIIEDSGAEYVLWPKRERSGALILQGLLATGRWRPAYEDYVSVLLERTDRPQRHDLMPSPDTAWRELTLGSAARAGNRLSEAEAHYQRALDLMPYLGAACFELVRVQGAQGRLDQARETEHRCAQLYPDPDSHDALTSWLDRLSAGTA